MGRITELELQNIRHLVLHQDMDACKFKNYVDEATEPTVKQFFQKSYDGAIKNKQDLMQFLN